MGVNGFLHGNVIDGVEGTKLLPLKRYMFDRSMTKLILDLCQCEVG